MSEGAVQIHDQWPNLCFRQPQIKGDAAKAFAASGHVVEADFKTQINHQAPLEPEVSVAYMEGEGEDSQLVVIGRSIDIHSRHEQPPASARIREHPLRGGVLGRPVRSEVGHAVGGDRFGAPPSISAAPCATCRASPTP